MKRGLSLLLIFVLAFAASAATSIQPPKGFYGKLWKGTLALYGTRHDKTHFLCTAEPIAKIQGGYRLLTAGHCVQEIPADIQFFVANEISGDLTPVTLVKAYDGDTMDFALFDLKTTKHYPVFQLGTEDGMHVGDETVNPHFALGIGKQITTGIISSMTIKKSEECDQDGCLGNFMVQDYAGPGASGSAIFSAKTHRIIGLLVFEFGANVGFAVEPISRFADFMVTANQPHPPPEGPQVIVHDENDQ